MRRLAAGLVLLALCGTGCGDPATPPAQVAPNLRLPPYRHARRPDDEPFAVRRRAGGGPIVMLFPGSEDGVGWPSGGLLLALERALADRPCTLVLCGRNQERRAQAWLRRELGPRRRQSGRPLALLGYAQGGAAAAELAGRLAATPGLPPVDLLVTVDALKKSYVGVATGTTAALMTLDRQALLAYTAAPPADGRRLRRHVNYYETESAFLRGAPMPQATENHRLSRPWPKTVRHGNIDSYAGPLAAADVLTLFEGAEATP
jgi:hypothetical protein